jgi:hypothetical protein
VDQVDQVDRTRRLDLGGRLEAGMKSRSKWRRRVLLPFQLVACVMVWAGFELAERLRGER